MPPRAADAFISPPPTLKTKSASFAAAAAVRAARGAAAAPRPLSNGVPGGGGGRRGARRPRAERRGVVAAGRARESSDGGAGGAAVRGADVQLRLEGGAGDAAGRPRSRSRRWSSRCPFDSLTIHLRAEDIDHDYDEHVGAVVLREFRSTMTFRASEALEVDMTLRRLRRCTARCRESGRAPSARRCSRTAPRRCHIAARGGGAPPGDPQSWVHVVGARCLLMLAEESAPARITTTKEASPMASLSAPMCRRLNSDCPRSRRNPPATTRRRQGPPPPTARGGAAARRPPSNSSSTRSQESSPGARRRRRRRRRWRRRWRRRGRRRGRRSTSAATATAATACRSWRSCRGAW